MKTTQTFFTPNGHDPHATYSISLSFFICPCISAALPLLLLCYWNKTEPDVGSWADRKGSTQRVNSFLPQSEAFLLIQCEMGWTKFNLAAVNRKVGRKIGFNKQSIKKKKKESTAGNNYLGNCSLCEEAGLYEYPPGCSAVSGGFSAARCLVWLVTKGVLWAEEICNCVVFQGNEHICHWSGVWHRLMLVKPRVVGQNGINTKGSSKCQQKWFTKIIHWPFHLPQIKHVKRFSSS